MSSTLTIRIDDETAKEIADLIRDGTSRNSAILKAIHFAHRQQILDAVRRESEELMHDEKDVAEMKRVMQDMESLRAW